MRGFGVGGVEGGLAQGASGREEVRRAAGQISPCPADLEQAWGRANGGEPVKQGLLQGCVGLGWREGCVRRKRASREVVIVLCGDGKELRVLWMTREGVQGAADPDTMSDSSSSGSGSEDEEQRGGRARAAQAKSETGDDPLELFSACVSAWSKDQSGEAPQSAREAGSDSKRKRKDRRVHRTAEERKQVGICSRSALVVSLMHTNAQLTSAPCMQRRLETNRLAAKRAYYRRQGKANAMKDENDQLRALVQRYGTRTVAALLLPLSRFPRTFSTAQPFASECSLLQLQLTSHGVPWMRRGGASGSWLRPKPHCR